MKDFIPDDIFDASALDLPVPLNLSSVAPVRFYCINSDGEIDFGPPPTPLVESYEPAEWAEECPWWDEEESDDEEWAGYGPHNGHGQYD